MVLNPMPEQRTYSVDEVDAALCVWEWLLARAPDATRRTSTNLTIVELFGNHGPSSMRSVALTVAVAVEKCWEMNNQRPFVEDRYDTFDWDFVPRMCELIDWVAVTEASIGGPYHMSEIDILDPVRLFSVLEAADALKLDRV